MKKIVALTLAAMMLLTAGTAMAASFPNFDFSGDVKAHYRWDTTTAGADVSGGKFFFRLNAESELSKDVTVYTRFAIQKLSGDRIGADFSDYYGANGASSLDRLGFIVKGKDFKYNIGRQGVTLGGLALLYSTDGYMGINEGAIDGVTISGKSGVTNLKVVAGQAWDNEAINTNLYAIDASYSPSKPWTLGATVMRTNADTDVNYWAVNAAYATGKATLVGEYGKADTNADDKAYAFGVTYGFDSKNSAFAIYNHVEDTFAWTDFDPNGKGMYYGFSHKINKDYTVDLFYKDMTKVSGVDAGKDYSSLRSTLTFKF